MGENPPEVCWKVYITYKYLYLFIYPKTKKWDSFLLVTQGISYLTKKDNVDLCGLHQQFEVAG